MVKKSKKKKVKEKEKKKEKKKLGPIQRSFMGRFRRAVKKNCGQNMMELALLDSDIGEIIADPNIGTPKQGILKGLKVHKVKRGSDTMLIAYKFDKRKRIIEFYDFDNHENFYRDLGNYLRNVK